MNLSTVDVVESLTGTCIGQYRNHSAKHTVQMLSLDSSSSEYTGVDSMSQIQLGEVELWWKQETMASMGSA